MPQVVIQQQREYCRRHHWMVKVDKYDPVTHTYAFSCRHVQCPVHGLEESRRRFRRRKKAFDDSRPFRSFILHYGFKPDPDEVVDDMEAIKDAFYRFDPKAVVGIQLHPKVGDFHLHIGVQSVWFDMEQWLSGYWCPEAKQFIGKRGPKKKNCLGCVGIELFQKLLVLRQARLVDGEFVDQPLNWLWYVMRCKDGWPPDEVLPKSKRYKLFRGLITRKRRPSKMSRAAIRAILLAAVRPLAVVIPVGLGLHEPGQPAWSRSSLKRRPCPPLPTRVRQSARSPPRIRSAGGVSIYDNWKASSQPVSGHGDGAYSAKSSSLRLERDSQYPGNPRWPSSRR